jgi:predicted transcriptional regulator
MLCLITEIFGMCNINSGIFAEIVCSLKSRPLIRNDNNGH